MTQNISAMTEKQLVESGDYLVMMKKKITRNEKREDVCALVECSEFDGRWDRCCFPNLTTIAFLAGMAVLSSKTET